MTDGRPAIRERLPPLTIRATVITLSEPGPVRTMCTLAASGFRVEAARLMMDSDLRQPSRNAARPEQRPDKVRPVLCVYCRTDKFVYWPPATRPHSPDCPACQE